MNSAFYQTVAGRIGPVARLRLGRLYVVDPVTRRSGFDRLKDVAKSASLGKFRLRLYTNPPNEIAANYVEDL